MPHTTEKHPGGTFVAARNVDYLTDVGGRSYRTNKGRTGVAYFFPLPLERGEFVSHWYFAPDYRRLTQVPKVRHVPLSLRRLGLTAAAKRPE